MLSVKRATFFIWALALCSLHAGTPLQNQGMTNYSTFLPVTIDGEITGPRGWFVRDYGRIELRKKDPRDCDGRRFFKFEFDGKGSMTLNFKKKGEANEGYFKKSFVIVPHGGWSHNCAEPVVPAPAFRMRFMAKTNSSTIHLPNRKRINPSQDFQTVDFTVEDPYKTERGKITVIPVPGMSVTFKEASVTPVYPKVGGSINLPDGGKLTKFIIPENAPNELRLGALTWRGWFWKLTGIALPIETEKEEKPAPGAFVIRLGESAPGGYILNIDKNGAVLTVKDARDAIASVFNYIRRHGVRLYSRDRQVIPAPNAKLTLLKLHENLKPRFTFFWMNGDGYLNGGAFRGELTSAADWYDSPVLTSLHNTNILLPMPLYRDKHPEYYMMEKDGTRQAWTDLVTPCLSNKEAMSIMQRRMIDFLKSDDAIVQMGYCMGDIPKSCQCKECLKLSNGTSYTDAVLLFCNMLQESLRKNGLDKQYHINHDAYHLYRFAPSKVKPVNGVGVRYCAQPRTMPCVVHVDCEVNRRSNADYKTWSKLVGKENLGGVYYEESRPYYDLQMLEYFLKYGTGEQFFYSFNSARRYYLAGRYRFGDDPIKAQEEFFDGYFGAGGKYLKQIYLDLDKYCKAYKHTPQDRQEFCVAVLSPRTIAWKTVLSREIFDSSYKLFDQALAATKDDKVAYCHILYDKFRFLLSDLPKYPRSNCRNEKELRAFGLRLADFMHTLIELDELKAKISLDTTLLRNHEKLLNTENEKDFLLAVSGMDIPKPQGKTKWHECQVIQEFLKDPGNYFIGKSGVKVIPGGYEWDPMAMFGGDGPSVHKAGGKQKVYRCMRRPASGKGTVSISLTLKTAPKHACRLIMEGVDDDKPGASTFKILVNGKQIFAGANTFSETQWTTMALDIPEGALKAGENRIEFINTMKELPSDRKKLPQSGIDIGDAYEVNYFRGWIIFSSIRLMDLSTEFAKFSAGKPTPVWERTVNKTYFNEKGTTNSENGKLRLATDVKRLRLGVSLKLQNQYAVRPGEKIRISVLIEGQGKFQLNVQGLDAANRYNRQSPLSQMNVPSQQKWMHWDLVVPKNTYYILPGILAVAGSDFTVSDFKLETVK